MANPMFNAAMIAEIQSSVVFQRSQLTTPAPPPNPSNISSGSLMKILSKAPPPPHNPNTQQPQPPLTTTGPPTTNAPNPQPIDPNSTHNRTGSGSGNFIRMPSGELRGVISKKIFGPTSPETSPTTSRSNSTNQLMETPKSKSESESEHVVLPPEVVAGSSSTLTTAPLPIINNNNNSNNNNNVNNNNNNNNNNNLNKDEKTPDNHGMPEKSWWTAMALKKHPEVLEVLERVRPLNRGVSFGRVYSAEAKTAVKEDPLGGDALLSLIIQHLQYEGLKHSKRAVEEETGQRYVDYQLSESRLLTLLRMAIRDTEKIWELTLADERYRDSQQALEEHLCDLGLLKEDLMGGDASEDLNIYDEPDTGNIIFADTKEEKSEKNEEKEKSLPNPSASSLSLVQPNASLLTSQASTSNLLQASSPEDRIRSLKAASINKLVVMLTPEKNHDMEYLKTFLLTYQSFTTPEKLLQKLIQRYHVPQKEGVTEEEWKKISLPIQLRVVNVIKTWIKDYWTDFNDKLLANLKAFIDNTLRVDNNIKLVTTLTQALNNKFKPEEDEENKKRTFNEPPPEPKVPKSIFSPTLDIFEVDEEETARQLTLIDFEIYSSIKPSELLNQSWNKPKLKHRSPNVLRTIARFNEVSNWVACSILSVPKIRDRARIYAKFVKIAEILMRSLNNFNTSMAILAGLNASSVHRLKFTKEEMPRHTQQMLQDLQTQLSSNQAYKEYRLLLSRANPPCIPYLGVYLTDLTFIEDGNPDLYQGLINFAKRKLVYNVIAQVKQYQQTAYNLQPVYQIAMLLWKSCKGSMLSEDEQYRLSMLREPRGKERTEIE